MLWLEADKDNLGIFINALYSVLTDTAQDGVVSLNAKSRFGLFSGGVSYQFPISTEVALSPYAGFRYTLNDVSLDVNLPTRSVDVSNNQNWIDPLIGLRALFQFNKA